MFDHKTKLVPDAKSPSQAPYQLAPPEIDELPTISRAWGCGVRWAIQGTIWSSSSVPKETWWEFQFYRAITRLTRNNNYPISLIVDLFDKLFGALYFLKLDLRFNGLLPCLYCLGGWSKDDLYNEICSIRLIGHALWLDQCPSHFLHIDEEHFQWDFRINLWWCILTRSWSTTILWKNMLSTWG